MASANVEDDMTFSESVYALREKTAERDKLLKQLVMWADVSQQGINPEDIASFGFDPDLMDCSLRKNVDADRRHLNGWSGDNPYAWPVVYKNGIRTVVPRLYNYVTMNDGRKVELESVIIPAEFA